MITAASAAGAGTAQPVTMNTAARAGQPPSPETARASAGETASNVKLATSKAVTASEQTAVAPRLRDQETAERTERPPVSKDAPTGPPPTFEESPLERQARVALEPPEVQAEPAFELDLKLALAEETRKTTGAEAPGMTKAEMPAVPPPTPSERAVASFAETKSIAEPRNPATVDVEL